MAKSKPVVSLRKPPKPIPEDADRFVAGLMPESTGQPLAAGRRTLTAVPLESLPSETVPHRPGDRLPRGTVKRASGEVLRRFTVYLEREAAERLRRHCFERDRDLSDVAAEAIRAHILGSVASLTVVAKMPGGRQRSAVKGQPSTADAQKLPRGAVMRATGEVLRRFTVYLDTETAERLRRHCFDHERDLSEVAAQAIGIYIDQQC